MNIAKDELREKLIKAALKIVSTEDAEYLADETIEAYIRKMPRTNPLKSTIGDLEASHKHIDEKIDYTVNLGSYISIDFNSHGPLTYLKKIHDELESRSAKNGLAMAAFTNSQSMHTLHTWVQGLAKRGLVAIAACNGGPGAVVPFNGTYGLFGTNPLAYGLPGKEGQIQCIDMATSEIPYFEIMKAYKDGEPLRERSAVDQKGEFTTDAKAALDLSVSEDDPISNIVPMGGGYKGYYIVYLMEMLTSGLIGMPSSPEMTQDKFVPEEHGAVLLVINPNAIGTKNQLIKSLEELNDAIKGQKPKAGESVRTPGEDNNRKFVESKNQIDLDVDDELLTKLDSLN